MNLYKKIFTKRNSLFVVIHTVSEKQASENVKIAFESGADGVFLINHNSDYKNLLEIHREIRRQYPMFWIGLNLLDLSVLSALDAVPDDTSGLWVDDAGLNEAYDDIAWKAKVNLAKKQEKKDWKGLYFGGIAFKYQKEVKQLDLIARSATKYADVIVTSGDKTGSPPDLAKIKTVRDNIGDFPFAIASGITPGNVGQYKAYVDAFLVATGISDNFTQLNSRKTEQLVKEINK